jgi:hypothetical protein
VHAACSTVAHGRAACWSGHNRTGRVGALVEPATTDRPDLDHGQWMPRGLAPDPVDGSGSQHPGPPAATESAERAPRSLEAMSRQHPEDHSPAFFIAISLISAVRTHALCSPTHQQPLTRRPPWTPSSPAARAAPPCTPMPYAALIRPREIRPRNPPIRRPPEHETAGQGPAPLHEVRA